MIFSCRQSGEFLRVGIARCDQGGDGDAPGFRVSTGSACSSATIEPSYVLRALGLSDEAAARTLRIGIGRFTSPADIDYAAAALLAAHAGAPAPATERFAQA